MSDTVELSDTGFTKIRDSLKFIAFGLMAGGAILTDVWVVAVCIALAGLLWQLSFKFYPDKLAIKWG